MGKKQEENRRECKLGRLSVAHLIQINKHLLYQNFFQKMQHFYLFFFLICNVFPKHINKSFRSLPFGSGRYDITTVAVDRVYHYYNNFFELSAGMSTKSFLLAFHRFFNTYFVFHYLYSDNAKVFIKCGKVSENFLQSKKVQEELEKK